MHHLPADLRTASVADLAISVSADLVVLSSATAEMAQLTLRAKREIAMAAPSVRVLARGPGDTVGRLLRLSRDITSPGDQAPG